MSNDTADSHQGREHLVYLGQNATSVWNSSPLAPRLN
jgi:hypothetical protein